MVNDIRPSTNDPITMKDKHEVVRNDQRVHRDTMQSRAEGEFWLSQQGRHAQSINQTGKWDGPNRIPRLPDTSPSNQMAMVGHEQPLGASVDDHEPVGEPLEIAKSIEQSGDSGGIATVPSSPEAAAGVEPTLAPPAAATPNPQPTIKRRGA